MTETKRLDTKRLSLVAGTAELGRAELDGIAKFALKLGARVPQEWPPPLNDAGSMTWFTEYLETHPDAVGWTAWYFLLKEPDGEYTAIGGGGFKGAPDSTGTVEIGYSILENYQCQGFASEGVHALIEWAFSHADVHRIIAQTFPDSRPSIRVLEKQGFLLIGDGFEDGAILYQLDRRDDSART
ncbi:MAG: GNAT family N-acetyltransferase [Pirellulales bacterium]|nr:GNAT family N-acetyltransferase [Pirellulales bacterium]